MNKKKHKSIKLSFDQNTKTPKTKQSLVTSEASTSSNSREKRENFPDECVPSKPPYTRSRTYTMGIYKKMKMCIILTFVRPLRRGRLLVSWRIDISSGLLYYGTYAQRCWMLCFIMGFFMGSVWEDAFG